MNDAPDEDKENFQFPFNDANKNTMQNAYNSYFTYIVSYTVGYKYNRMF